MSRKPKFRPRVTRIKLNPEQAVLACDCWNTGRKSAEGWARYKWVPHDQANFLCVGRVHSGQACAEIHAHSYTSGATSS